LSGLVLLAPLIVFAPTALNLTGYDIQECIALENTLYITYSLGVKILLSVVMLLHLIYRIFVTPSAQTEKGGKRTQTALLALGTLTFIYAFLIAGYISEQTLDYRYELYGLFGMVVFITILAYMIVKYQAFNVQMLAVQALTAALVLLVGAQFLFVRTPINIALTAVTFVFISITSVFLVRSVKREIKLKEELAQANAGQERFIHFLSHEIKGFITVARNGYASIIDGDFGPASEPLTVFSKKAFERLNTGVTVVESILKSANLKSGKVTFKFVPFDICSAIRKRIELAQPLLKERNLTLDAQLPDGDYIIVGDAENLTDHVLRNLIENAIFYTPAGTIRVMLSRKANSVVFSVKDTGVGITPEDKKRLFTEGGQGANAMKVNAHSTGHGLFIAKSIVEAHGGRIWAESEGEGKGTTFFVELPINPPQEK
jgi:signal transduction histidine kinase